MVLSLEFRDNGTLHDDLLLRIGSQEVACDSYYLALDKEHLPDREDAFKVREVLARLLKQWMRAIQQLADGGTAYLPFDFSDQYTAWLACRRSGQQVDVSLGWATIEGWAISPAAIGSLTAVPREFQVTGPTMRLSLSDVLEAIRHSLSSLD